MPTINKSRNGHHQKLDTQSQHLNQWHGSGLIMSPEDNDLSSSWGWSVTTPVRGMGWGGRGRIFRNFWHIKLSEQTVCLPRKTTVSLGQQFTQKDLSSDPCPIWPAVKLVGMKHCPSPTTFLLWKTHLKPLRANFKAPQIPFLSLVLLQYC